MSNDLVKTQVVVEKLLKLKISQKQQDEKFRMIYNQIIFSLTEVLASVINDTSQFSLKQAPKWKFWNWENLLQKDFRDKSGYHWVIEELYSGMLSYKDSTPELSVEACVPTITNQLFFEAYINWFRKYIWNIVLIDNKEK